MMLMLHSLLRLHVTVTLLARLLPMRPLPAPTAAIASPASSTAAVCSRRRHRDPGVPDAYRSTTISLPHPLQFAAQGAIEVRAGPVRTNVPSR